MKKYIIFAVSVLILNISLVFQALAETKVQEYEFSQAELDQILAPIALFPDTILSHILIASTYPLEIIQAERWTSENPNLKGDAALNAVEKKDWDPSVKALVPFPNILKQMSEDLDWMQKLGDAFLQNEELVLATIQDLRQRAYDEGSLENLEHLSVSHEDNDIIIEPAVKEVVYVPYYDTRVVYGSWWWVDYPPIYWTHYHHHHYRPGLSFYWGPSVVVGSGFYFSSFHWHNHRVVIVDRHYARRHHFHTGRHVARYDGARTWIHDTRHRRGVEYRQPRISRTNGYSSARSPELRDRRNASQVSERLQRNHSRTAVTENRSSRHNDSGSASRQTTSSQRSYQKEEAQRVRNSGASTKYNRTSAQRHDSDAQRTQRNPDTRQYQSNEDKKNYSRTTNSSSSDSGWKRQAEESSSNRHSSSRHSSGQTRSSGSNRGSSQKASRSSGRQSR